jgi:hypothetical protein
MFLLLGCGGVPQTTEPSGSESKPADTTSAPSSEVEKPKNEYGVRGSAMIPDENGVEIYEALGEYRVKSKKDAILKTVYQTKSASEPKKTSAKNDDRYPDLTVDWTLYYDKSIVGTSPVIRYGLSEFDSVTYIDKNGNKVEGEAPRALTASNGGDPSFNGGYGENEKGETTRFYKDKSVLFYIINHYCSDRIGMEDDVSILSDYIEQGYLVVVLDYKNHEDAISPYIEQSLVSAFNLFNRTKSGHVVGDLVDADGDKITTTENHFYFLPEGCRLERDVWYYDPSIWSLNGIMERNLEVWNTKVAGTQYDTLKLGKFNSVEDMICNLTQVDGETPLEYKLCMNIVYPSQPKDGYKAPLYIQEGTSYVREEGIQTSYTRGTYMGFALNGYACVQYDHAYYTFIYNRQYKFEGSGGNYGISQGNFNNARAAVRCAKYYADILGYDKELVGAAGISKATDGLSVLSVVNNKELLSSMSGYNNQCLAGDVFEDGVEPKQRTPENRILAIVEPFATYEDGVTEVSSDVKVAYCSAGNGLKRLFGSGTWANLEHVPMVISDGVRDEYNCYDYFEEVEAWYEDNMDKTYLLIPQLDQGHTYPVGYDDQYGYDRFLAMISFFDVYLKPDEARAPEVIWMTPIDGAANVPVSGQWTSGPWTPYGWEMNSYERVQRIQVKFVDAVDPESVNRGMILRDEAGNVVSGTWIAGQSDTLFTFVTSGLSAGTKYSLTATEGIVSKNGVPLFVEVSVHFTTEGTLALSPVADTYVSASKPNAVFGDRDALTLDHNMSILVSYPAAELSAAKKIVLSGFVQKEANFSVSVYALADYKVDEATLTYSALTASDAYQNKIALGKYKLTSRKLSIDLSTLSKKQGLGEYVTLLLISDQGVSEGAYSFSEDFESYEIGKAVTGKDSTGKDIVVLNESGVITDGTVDLDNRVYSDYIFRRYGAFSRTYVLEEDGSMVFRTQATAGHGIKFYNSLKDSPLTAEDVGKTYRVSFRIKISQDGIIKCGITSANSGEGGSGSYGSYTGAKSSYGSSFCGLNYSFDVAGDTWTDITFVITVTQAMVDAQAGLLTINPPSYSTSAYTWFDDIVVEETTPRLTAETIESDSSSRLTLVIQK